MPTRQLLVGAGVSAVGAWLVWSLLWNNVLGDWWIWPLVMITPDGWFQSWYFVIASWVYYVLVYGGIIVFFGRLGRWGELVRRARAAVRRANARAVASGAVAAPPAAPAPEADPALWPQLRLDGAAEVADRLSAELRDGLMTDVDYARIDHAWRTGRARGEIEAEVRARGAAACLHGSGARDIPGRTARHDLAVRQVRIGAAVDVERTPRAYRGAGIALDPAVLGTSALVVGPSGRDTEGVVRPVIESLCLQALAGQAAVVAVTSSGGAVAPPEGAFDVVVRTGGDGGHGLDLYAGLTDADEVAAVLAEALVGDLAEAGADGRWAAVALSQLLGPWRAVHGRWPEVGELRDLLDTEAVRADLRAALDARGDQAHLRDLGAFERRTATSRGAVESLAARVALLDRPAFRGFLTASDDRAFSLRRIDRPVRVHVVLPERIHAEASRIIARLVLAQFTACASTRRDRNQFAFLVLEDALHTVTPYALRALQQLRTSHAGVLLTLRTLADVPEGLRDPLLAAVGCRVVCSGVSSWDARHFSAAWGTEWVDTRIVTHRQVFADRPFTRAVHMLRKVITGKHVTTEAVTVRREERERWSASELATGLEAGHAVISLASVSGGQMPPILTRLGA
ncbi:ATP-binding protein [Streptomyces misionensis]|uniref:ATP-binding protein n=1 Tax=Streptomyces misionensis TaxID=67331 RepID=UPI003691FDBB